MFTRPLSLVLLLAVSALAAGSLTAKALAAQELTMRCDPPSGSLSRLTKAQKKAFMHSRDLFVSEHFSDAVAELRGLLAELPPNTPAQTAMAERTAEAAIEAGD